MAQNYVDYNWNSSSRPNVEEYRRRYSNLPFYGLTTNQATYQPILSRDHTSQSLADKNHSSPRFEPTSGRDIDEYEDDPRNSFDEDSISDEIDYVQNPNKIYISADPSTSNENPLSYQYAKVPFYGDTTHRSHFTRKPVEKATSFKPSRRSALETPNFESDSTENSPKMVDNKEADDDNDQRTPQSQRNFNLPRSSPAHFVTTNRSVHGPKPTTKRPDAFRPKQLYLGSGRPFETTTNRSEYVPKQVERTKPYKPLTNIVYRDGTVQSSTTNASDYRPWEPQKTWSFKPASNRRLDDSFENVTTTSREAYVLKFPQICPAELLLRSRSDFRHVYDSNGHRFYRKISLPNESLSVPGRRNSSEDKNFLPRINKAMLIG